MPPFAHLEAQGPDGPPLGGVKTSSSISIRLPGDRRRFPFRCRTADGNCVASLKIESSVAFIDGYSSGRVPVIDSSV